MFDWLFGTKKPDTSKEVSEPKQSFTRKKDSRPAYSNQIDYCKKVGIAYPPDMTQAQYKQLVESSRKDPAIRQRMDELERQQQDEIEREEREEYGSLYDDFKKWESICDDTSPHILIFRRGKKAACEVVEFESVEMEISTKKPYLVLNVLAPKLEREDGYSMYSWDKELRVKVSAVLHQQKLDTSIDVHEPHIYKQVIAQTQAHTAAKYPDQ